MKKIFLFAISLTGLTNTDAQNVGIGTTTPTVALDVNSPAGYTSRFNGGNQMYIGFFENNVLRGYAGSFSGAAEDFDIGTSSGNSVGKLHLTTMATPRMTINNTGNVGIGNLSPVEKLDINGSIKMTGELKPGGVAGTSGQVLTSNGNGTMQWSSLTSTSGSTSGNGGWGDCSIYNIDSYYPAANANGEALDVFGKAVAISGNYAIVGAPGDDEELSSVTGSVTFYQYNPASGAWVSQGKILNPNAENFDNFGCSVSISGDYAIVGAFNDSELGVQNCGSATIFKRNSATGVWESQGKLTNPSPASNDWFGHAVSISGDYAIVGAPNDDEGGFQNTGSATFFKRNSTTGVWESQGKVLNPSAQASDQFGYSVSIHANYAIIGAPFDQSPGALSAGSVSIFKRNATTGVWDPPLGGKLVSDAPTDNMRFGQAVSIYGDLVAVGSPQEDLGVINGGSVTIFKRNEFDGWLFSGKVTGPGRENEDNFGSAVSISDGYLIAGCASDDDQGMADVGTATIFRKAENFWLPHQKFSQPYGSPNSFFGGAVSLDPVTNRFIVGASGYAQSTGLVHFGRIK